MTVAAGVPQRFQRLDLVHLLLLVPLAAGVLVLILRNTGIYPSVFWDEYVYSHFARLGPIPNTPIPSFLYLEVYRITNACGDGFLQCAQILNVAFFAAAILLVYLTTKNVAGRVAGLAVALMTLVSPINTYTFYFMPESMYFFVFWTITYLALRPQFSKSLMEPLLLGSLIGIAALVKVSALFLLPAVVTAVYVHSRKGGLTTMRTVWHCVAVVAMTAVLKITIGYAIAGASGISLFGGVYGQIASGYGLGRIINLTSATAISLFGHALGLSLIFPVALGIFPSKMVGLWSKDTPRTELAAFSFALVVLLSLVLVAALYTAMSAGTGAFESIYRIHMRYYDFALPLLLTILAADLKNEKQRVGSSLLFRLLSAFPIGILMLYAIYTRMIPYGINYMDSPNLRGIISATELFYASSWVGFAFLCLWVIEPFWTGRFYLYVLLPAVFILSGLVLNREIRQHETPTVAEKAGYFVEHYLSPEDLAHLVVVGPYFDILESLFYISRPTLQNLVIGSDAPFDLQKLPPGTSWILVLGDQAIPQTGYKELALSGFRLEHIAARSSLPCATGCDPN